MTTVTCVNWSHHITHMHDDQVASSVAGHLVTSHHTYIVYVTSYDFQDLCQVIWSYRITLHVYVMTSNDQVCQVTWHICMMTRCDLWWLLRLVSGHWCQRWDRPRSRSGSWCHSCQHSCQCSGLNCWSDDHRSLLLSSSGSSVWS